MQSSVVLAGGLEQQPLSQQHLLSERARVWLWVEMGSNFGSSSYKLRDLGFVSFLESASFS